MRTQVRTYVHTLVLAAIEIAHSKYYMVFIMTVGVYDVLNYKIWLKGVIKRRIAYERLKYYPFNPDLNVLIIE